jgi:nucleotide-binding universal stress UspA family protein
MKIICGTDLSENSKRNVAAANALAIRFKSKLDVVHVMHQSLLDTMAEGVREMHRSECEDGLESIAKTLNSRGDRATTHLAYGNADEELTRLAEDPDVELLTVGRFGHRDGSRWLLGSSAERIAESSHVPTLVVRDETPFQDWGPERPLKIMVAWEFDETSENALRAISKWRRYGPCEITVVHLDWPDSESHRLGLRADYIATENSALVQEVLERDVRRRATAILGEEPKFVLVEGAFGRLDAHWSQVANDLKPDLVVCGTHQRQGLSRLTGGSFSRGLLHNCDASLLMVPFKSVTSAVIPRFRTVLVATDFSELANHAIPIAYAQANGGGTVHLIHIVDPFDTGSPFGLAAEAEVDFDDEEATAAELRRRLTKLVPVTASHRGIRTEVHIVRSSDVPASICQCGDRFGVDLICLGSHGRSGFSKIALGSVANAVIARTNHPVTVVKEPTR